jgi:ketosteroid isomerase-like protein
MIDAREIALAYHHAWARRDLAGALTAVADDVVCDVPSGQTRGILEFADLVSAQLQVLEHTDVLVAFGSGDTAVVFHHDQTITRPSVLMATHVSVADGRITRMRQVADCFSRRRSRASR